MIGVCEFMTGAHLCMSDEFRELVSRPENEASPSSTARCNIVRVRVDAN